MRALAFRLAAHRDRRSIMTRLAGLALFGVALASWGPAMPAQADLRFCNRTDSRVSVAIGYKDTSNWRSEGWWNFDPQSCQTILPGELVARYYYFYAVDIDRGGIWGDNLSMCIRDRLFTIIGVENCIARGYDKAGFREVDTGDFASWTIALEPE